jgi:hypothetical protein
MTPDERLATAARLVVEAAVEWADRDYDEIASIAADAALADAIRGYRAVIEETSDSLPGSVAASRPAASTY